MNRDAGLCFCGFDEPHLPRLFRCLSVAACQAIAYGMALLKFVGQVYFRNSLQPSGFLRGVGTQMSFAAGGDGSESLCSWLCVQNARVALTFTLPLALTPAPPPPLPAPLCTSALCLCLSLDSSYKQHGPSPLPGHSAVLHELGLKSDHSDF